MKLRIGLLGILICCNIGLIVFIFYLFIQPKAKMEPANVTVQEAIDQAESMEHPDFVKEEYVLDLPEGENIALKKKVKANNFNDVYTPRKVVDGVAVGVSYWESKEYPATIMIDLAEPSVIHAIRLCLSPMAVWGRRTQTIGVTISDDGEVFKELYPVADYEFDPDRGNEVQFRFEEVEARYVQLEFTGNTGAGGGQLAEFEIYQKR